MAKRPAMPKSDPETAQVFEALVPEDARITIRPMFGHKAAFVNGHMFAGTFGTDMFVRLDDRSRDELLAVPGAAPFEPMKGRPMKGYVVLPRRLGGTAAAKAWIERALDSTAILPPKAERTVRRGKKPTARRTRA